MTYEAASNEFFEASENKTKRYFLDSAGNLVKITTLLHAGDNGKKTTVYFKDGSVEKFSGDKETDFSNGWKKAPLDTLKYFGWANIRGVWTYY